MTDLESHTNFKPYQAKPDEEYMNEQQANHFRAILHEWRQSLMTGVDRTVDHMKTDATTYADPNDRASQESDIGLELRTRDRERKLITKIEKTLNLIDEHEYGFCKTCGVEIGIRRLEARPTADLCIDCKTNEEDKEHQFSR